MASKRKAASMAAVPLVNPKKKRKSASIATSSLVNPKKKRKSASIAAGSLVNPKKKRKSASTAASSVVNSKKKRKASSSVTDAQPEEQKPDEEREGEEESVDESLKRESIRKLLEPFGKDQIIELLKQAASKDLNLLSRVTQFANSDSIHRKIFVHGLSWDATAEQVLDAFRTYGEIEDCKLIADKVTGKTKGYGFVLFKTRAAAQKALEQPQKQIGNRITSCQLAAAGPTAAAPDSGCRKIFVANVGPNITGENLHAFFLKFGEIEEGPSGKPRGFAIFVYKTVEGAKKALEEPLKMFEGCQLHCRKFVENLNSNASVNTGNQAVQNLDNSNHNAPVNNGNQAVQNLNNNSNNNAPVNTGNQAVLQSDIMNFGIGINPLMFGLTTNLLLGFTISPLGTSIWGNYGMNSLNPGMIGDYGSHLAPFENGGKGEVHVGSELLIKWVPPGVGAVKVNTDGSAQGYPGNAGAGGLIRDALGRWIVGFRAFLGVCTYIEAELQAVRRGLELAWSRGYRRVECEVDAKFILEMIKGADTVVHPLGALIEDIRGLRDRNWICELKHTLREGNFCADYLAKSGCDIELEYELLSEPPKGLQPLLEADSRGEAVPRGHTN